MAPYLEHIKADRADLIKSLKEKNDKQLSEFDEKLKEAEENQGESEISALLRSKAMYLTRIGDKVGCDEFVKLIYRKEQSRLSNWPWKRPLVSALESILF